MKKSTLQKAASLIKPWHVLAALIALNISIALFIGNDYGEAWDEPSYYLYGERSFDAYLRGLAGQELIPQKHIYFIDLRYYGPFYTALGWYITNSLTAVFANWSYPDIWHFVNFGFFQLSLVALYHVAKRFLNRWTAVGVVLLFSTQPLIFGHAFINPKDIPFMTFLTISIASGMAMAEAIQTPREGKAQYSRHNLIAAILFGLFIFTIVGKDVIAPAIGSIVTFFYNAPADSIWEEIFSMLANRADRLPLESYTHKAVALGADRILVIAAFLIITTRKAYLDYTQGGIRNIRLTLDRELIARTLFAGLLLGLTTSIRLLGPFAGLLIAGYALLTSGKKSFTPLIYYFSVAALVTYLTWPFLWDQPVSHFIESLQVMRDFPFTGAVRFMGDNIAPSSLPWSYIPVLITVQITEPVVLLAWIGFFTVSIKSLKNPTEAKRNSLIFAWLILPVGLHILLKSSAYDNFRQFIFILPPMFILAGMGWETIRQKINNQWIKAAVFILLLIPGLAGIASLHPYQYIYYNGFVGGLPGAAENFETDYWLTSYRETADYINNNASKNAWILAWGAGYNVRGNVRQDLTVFDFDTDDVEKLYEYAVITTRFDNHIHLFTDAEVVFEVRKKGVLLAVVKKIK